MHAIVDIRAAVRADAASIAALMDQLGYPLSSTQVQQNLARLRRSRNDRVLVAVAGGLVAGCISLHAMPLFHQPGTLGRITALVVDARQRGRGIGGLLLAHAQAWFDAMQCRRAEVTSGDHRRRAHRFYQRHGYARHGRQFLRESSP